MRLAITNTTTNKKKRMNGNDVHEKQKLKISTIIMNNNSNDIVLGSGDSFYAGQQANGRMGQINIELDNANDNAVADQEASNNYYSQQD